MRTNLGGFLFLAAMVAAVLRPAVAADPIPQQIVKINGEDVSVYAPGQVQPVRTAKPDYPRPEQENGIEGHVVLAALIGFDGRVIESQVTESRLSPSFGESAKACLVKWRFPKLKRDGAPTKYLIQVPFEFLLQNR